MSAPAEAYLDEKLPLQDVGVVKYDNLLALKLSEYGSNIKSLFYLDALLVAKENGGTKEGFCGLVLVGGNNAAMHNTARWGKGRTSPDGGATKYIILNDGGLNTYASSNVDTIKNTAVNYLKADYSYKSSYYAYSTSRGYEIRANNGSWYDVLLDNAVLPATNEETKFDEYFYSTFSHPSLVEIRPYIVNEEGKRYGSSVIFNTTPEIEMLGAIKRNSACSNIGQTLVEFWMLQSDVLSIQSIPDTASNTGIYAYTNDELTEFLGNGFYWGLKTNYAIQVQSGEMIQAIYCPPPSTTKDFEVRIFNEFNPDNEDLIYSVSVTLPVSKGFDITIIGAIASFNSMNQQLSNDSGNGNFIITIPAGGTDGSHTTTYIPSPDWEYLKCVVASTSPSGLTYDSFEY